MSEFPIWRFGAFAGSLIPGVIIILMLLRRGEKSLAPRLLWLAISSGAMIAILPYALTLFEPFLSRPLTPFFSDILKAYCFAGLFEEGAKLLACWFIVRPYYLRRSGRDLILACAGVGLGFALLENITYVMRASDQWKSVALSRALTSVPIHAFLGLGLGAGLAAAQTQRSRTKTFFWAVSSYLIAAALHGFYDFPLFLAEKFPLTPLQINAAAAMAAIHPQTFVTLIMAAAETSISAWALYALHLCRWRGADELDPPIFPVSRWKIVDKILFARGTGVLAGAVFLGVGAFILVIGLLAGMAGALPSTLFLFSGIGLILATIGLGFGEDALMGCMRHPARILKMAGELAQKCKLPEVVGATAAVMILGAVCYWGYYGVRRGVAEVLTSSGATFLDNGATDAALENFSRALSYKNDFIGAFIGRASAQRALQRYDEALATLDEAVNLAPKNPEVYFVRANIRRTRHEYRLAYEDFNRALELQPDQPEFLIARGSTYLDDGDVAAASQDLDGALALKPDLLSAHLLRAQIYMQQDDLNGVARECTIVLLKDPKNAGAAFMRGRVLFFKGDYGAALADFRTAMQNGERGYVGLWLYLAGAWAGKDDEVAREVSIWVQVMPQNAWPFPLIKFFLGAESVDNLKAAAVTNDQNCEMDFYVAELMLLEKMTARATEIFQRAASTCPKDFVEYDGARIELKKLAAMKADKTGSAPDLVPDSPPAGAGGRRYIWSFTFGAKNQPPRLEIKAKNQSDKNDYVLTLTPADGDQPTAGYLLTLHIQKLGEGGAAAPWITMSFETAKAEHSEGETPPDATKLSLIVYNLYQASLTASEAERVLSALSKAREFLLKAEKSSAPLDAIAITSEARTALGEALAFIAKTKQAP